MKKFFKKFSFVFILILMSFFIIRNYNSNDNKTIAASSTDDITVNLINGNEKAGKMVFQIEGSTSGEYGEAKSTGTAKLGDRIRISFDGGLNEGYSISLWANFNGETYTPVLNASSELYTSERFTFRITESVITNNTLSVYCAALSESDHLVTFSSTASTTLSGIIGYSVVEDGGSADLSNVVIPARRGFDFEGFSQSLDNITSDLVVYPTFDSNIGSIFRDYWQLFAKGLGVTLLLAIISIFLSLFLGLLLCLGKISSLKPLKVISSAYIEVIRGVPSLLLLLIVYSIFGPTRIHIGSFFSTEVLSCIIALFLNSSAYTAEIFRSGIQAVDGGQMEAGRALGLSNWQVLRKVVIPQGLKNALPSLGNELVMIIKETSLAYSINSAIGELMSAKVSITSATGNSLSPYFIIAIIYFVVTFSLSRVIMYLEKRLSQ